MNVVSCWGMLEVATYVYNIFIYKGTPLEVPAWTHVAQLGPQDTSRVHDGGHGWHKVKQAGLPASNWDCSPVQMNEIHISTPVELSYGVITYTVYGIYMRLAHGVNVDRCLSIFLLNHSIEIHMSHTSKQRVTSKQPKTRPRANL